MAFITVMMLSVLLNVLQLRFTSSCQGLS